MTASLLYTISAYKSFHRNVPLSENRGNLCIYYRTSKREILTFVTTWMNLEGIILCEISEKPKLYGTVLYVK